MDTAAFRPSKRDWFLRKLHNTKLHELQKHREAARNSGVNTDKG